MVQAPSQSRLSATVTGMVILLSVFSSVLSTMGLISLIPAVLAVSGAATSWTSYKNTDLQLQATNGSINELNKLLIWWDSLSMIEKRVGANKEFLVVNTELAIQSQVVGVNSKTEKKEEQEDEGEKA
jgi:SMODS and SLOG-associating 2TM effector domain 1